MAYCNVFMIVQSLLKALQSIPVRCRYRRATVALTVFPSYFIFLLGYTSFPIINHGSINCLLNLDLDSFLPSEQFSNALDDDPRSFFICFLSLSKSALFASLRQLAHRRFLALSYLTLISEIFPPTLEIL